MNGDQGWRIRDLARSIRTTTTTSDGFLFGVPGIYIDIAQSRITSHSRLYRCSKWSLVREHSLG